MSILNGEYIKIGYTKQKIDKRKCALQTGNPYEINVMFSIEGTLKQEQVIHKSLKEAFERIKVFNNPTNEWYPGQNSMIKNFILSIKRFGIEYAIEIINNIKMWKKRVKPKEIFSIRKLEKELRKKGLSIKEAKTIISKNKMQLMSELFNSNQVGVELGVSPERARQMVKTADRFYLNCRGYQ